MVKRFLAVMVAALSVACGPKQVEIGVKVVTTVCDAALDPFDGVNFVQLRVYGDGIEPALSINQPRTANALTLPEIPAGANRVIEVRGYADDPEAMIGRPISIGRSLPFTIDDVVNDTNRTKDITVFLRRVDSFTPPSSVTNPQDCAVMRKARAGHSATLLQDGRVYLAGGYQRQSSGELNALADAEFFDPSRGVFEDAPRMTISMMQIALYRAFHTATLLRNGQVLLYGGEQYTGGTANVVSAQSSVLIYDPPSNQYGAVPSRRAPEPTSIARTRHSAVIDSAGRVLIVGGIAKRSSMMDFAPVPEVEWFDPTSNTVHVVAGESMPRTDLSAGSVQGGALIAVAGGSDGTTLKSDVVFYKYSDQVSSFVRDGTAQQLKTARRSAATAAMGTDGADLVLFGGYTDPTQVLPDSTSEIVKTRQGSVDFGPAVGSRGNSCAALLPGNRVLSVGGRTVDAPGMPPRSDSAAIVVSYEAGTGQYVPAAASPLKVPRWAHTCTTLADGSVLVTGGLNESPTPTVLQDAWIYTPIPPP